VQLTTIPESIGNLTNLRILNLSENQLTALPISFGNLPKLQNLNLSNNQFATLKESCGNLTSLIILDLGSNQLASVPESIGNNENLSELVLNNNKLTMLPKSFDKLTKLKELDLRDNQLQTIPESIGNLINLQILNVRGNQLETIPVSIGNLTNLKQLNLYGNQLSTIPHTFINLNLTSSIPLNVDSNNICIVSIEMATWLDTTIAKSTHASQWRNTQKCGPIIIVGIEPNAINMPKESTFQLSPFTYQVTITFPQGNQANSLYIYNINGELVQAFEGVSESVTWNTQGQSRGVYYLKAVVGEEQVVRKFVLD